MDPIVTTEAPVTNQAPEAVPETSGLDDLAAALAALPEPQEGEAPEAPEGEEPQESEPETKAEAPKPPKGSYEALFTEEALSTPEGVKAAKDALNRHRRKVDGLDIRLQKQQRAWQEKRDSELADIRHHQATWHLIRGQLGLLRPEAGASTSQVLDALAQLTGRPGQGLKVYEELTQAVLKDGKPAKQNPEVQALQTQIQELRNYIESQQTQAKQQAEEAESQAQEQFQSQFVDERSQQIVDAASNAEAYPHLSHFVELGRGAEIVKETIRLKKAAKAQGQRLDDSTCLKHIEEELAQLVQQPSVGRPNGQARSTGQDPAKKPGGSQRRSPPTASIAPSATRSHTSVREMTDQERLEDLKRDTDFLKGFFGF